MKDGLRDSTKFKVGDRIRCLKTPRDPSNIAVGDIAVVLPSTSVDKQNASKLMLCVLRKGSSMNLTDKTYCIWEQDEGCYQKIDSIDLPIEDIINHAILEIDEIRKEEEENV